MQRSLSKKSQLSDWQALLTLQQQKCTCLQTQSTPQYKFISFADAADDAHAGLAIYNHLYAMLGTTAPVPSPSCYSFDCVRGRLCQPSGAHWSAYNPHYDPGPPPPPKDPNHQGGVITNSTSRQPTPAGLLEAAPISQNRPPVRRRNHWRAPPQSLAIQSAHEIHLRPTTSFPPGGATHSTQIAQSPQNPIPFRRRRRHVDRAYRPN